MADWGTFAGFAGVVLAALLLLARLSQRTVSGDAHADATGRGRADERVDSDVADSPAGPSPFDPREPGGEHDSDGPETAARGRRANGGAAEATDVRVDAVDAEFEVDPDARGEGATGPAHRQVREGRERLSTGTLLVNVALSQGLLGGLLALGAWYTGVPPAALGLGGPAFAPAVLLAGCGLGVGLYLVNEAGAAVGERFGLGGSEELRAMLAPDSTAGWALLLGGVLPIIALFEEFLFRAVLVGALAAGFGVSPWLLAGLSSLAFAAGHGAQGPAGIVVTGALGLVLAAAFVVTESLAAVVVAHYLVNALEFAVHEGLGFEWSGNQDGEAGPPDG